jgi:hypothetical protein
LPVGFRPKFAVMKEKNEASMQKNCGETMITPMSVYMYDRFGNMNPLKMFTVSRKRVNQQGHLEYYIVELDKFVEYNPFSIVEVLRFRPN